MCVDGARASPRCQLEAPHAAPVAALQLKTPSWVSQAPPQTGPNRGQGRWAQCLTRVQLERPEAGAGPADVSEVTDGAPGCAACELHSGVARMPRRCCLRLAGWRKLRPVQAALQPRRNVVRVWCQRVRGAPGWNARVRGSLRNISCETPYTSFCSGDCSGDCSGGLNPRCDKRRACMPGRPQTRDENALHVVPRTDMFRMTPCCSSVSLACSTGAICRTIGSSRYT